ncbi:DUF4326 domain-containing protein [Gemmata sp.]|uniref:DUF4326 domain-containing protein n=1 Tax=Gemmata sp. TaxID=1914242 RepID=UPI003F7201EE
MIRVVNVKGMNKPADRAGVVYCGRPFAGWKGHALGNPFRPKPGDPIGTCLERYRKWLLARPTLDADLAALWEETGRGAKPLGCWCVSAAAGDGSEVVCHAQILAEMLRERFARGGAA